MKWNGIVSQLGQSAIATRFAPAKANQATSTPRVLSSRESIPAMPHRLDRRLRAELLPEPPDADVDHVGARVEVVAPDVREEALSRNDLALVQDEVVQQAELAVRELRNHVAELRLPPREVERERSRVHDVAVLAVPAP